MGLGYTDAFLTIAATDFDSVVGFYQQLLARSPHPLISGVYAEFQLSGLRLGIFKPKASHQAEFAASKQAGMSLCLEVQDLDEAIAHLTTMGHPPPGTITVASHGREVYAYDPNGNRLILHESA